MSPKNVIALLIIIIMASPEMASAQGPYYNNAYAQLLYGTGIPYYNGAFPPYPYGTGWPYYNNRYQSAGVGNLAVATHNPTLPTSLPQAGEGGRTRKTLSNNQLINFSVIFVSIILFLEIIFYLLKRLIFRGAKI